MILNENCPCKRAKCPRHGNCILCREHHKELNNLPYCDRLKAKEERKLKRQKNKE